MGIRGIIGIALLIGVAAFFIIQGMQHTSPPYAELGDLEKIAKQVGAGKEYTKVSFRGEIVDGSIQRTDYGMLFVLIDEKDQKVPIQFHGVAPQSLQTGREVVAKCKVYPDETVISHELIVKCPSKYEEEESAGLAHPGSPFKELAEVPGLVKDMGAGTESLQIRLRGKIVAGSIQTTDDGATFTLADDQEHTLQIRFRGVVPEFLEAGRRVIATCTVFKDGAIESDALSLPSY